MSIFKKDIPNPFDSPAFINGYWFPGRWVGGISLILGPLLILAGVITRIQFHFFFPQQLAAYQNNSEIINIAYRLFLVGNIIMAPAVITVAKLIGQNKPNWATWGGMLVLLGLFARTFYAGIDHLAFQLVPLLGLEQATNTIATTYGAFHIVSAFSFSILTGWVVLAVGAYLSGTFGLIRSIALGCMAALMIGVLKGSTAVSIVATACLCIALVPLGIKVLQRGPATNAKTILFWSVCVVAVAGIFFFLGQQG